MFDLHVTSRVDTVCSVVVAPGMSAAGYSIEALLGYRSLQTLPYNTLKLVMIISSRRKGRIVCGAGDSFRMNYRLTIQIDKNIEIGIDGVRN